jgi:hypothetical protein
MLLAWIKGLDRRGTGLVTKADFLKACSEVSFGGNASKLFRKLKPEVGRQFLCLRDFDTKAYLALSRGDYRMLTEGQGVQIPEEGMLYMSFEERQNCGFFHQIRQAWDASRRDEFAKACLLANVAEHRIDTSEELEHLCIRSMAPLSKRGTNAWTWTTMVASLSTSSATPVGDWGTMET